jgi:hypothetical protein
MQQYIQIQDLTSLNGPMHHQKLALLSLALLLTSSIASCSSEKPVKTTATPTATPTFSITKPINKAKDTKTNVEQLSKDREKLNPEQPDPAKQ